MLIYLRLGSKSISISICIRGKETTDKDKEAKGLWGGSGVEDILGRRYTSKYCSTKNLTSHQRIKL